MPLSSDALAQLFTAARTQNGYLPTHTVQIESTQPEAAFKAALAEEGYAAA